MGELTGNDSGVRKEQGSGSVFDVNLHHIWSQKLMTPKIIPKFQSSPCKTSVNKRTTLNVQCQGVIKAENENLQLISTDI